MAPSPPYLDIAAALAQEATVVVRAGRTRRDAGRLLHDAVAALVRGDFRRAVTTDWDEFFEERAEAWDWFRAVLTGNNGTEFIRKVAGGRKTASREDLEKMIVLFRGFGRDHGRAQREAGKHPEADAPQHQQVD